MIKKILPVMIGATLAAGMTSSVLADVTAMGHLDMSGNFTKERNNNDRFRSLQCTTCSFGFKGSEDLGNGLKAIFKIDFQYDMTERNRVTGGNNANVTVTTTTTSVTTGGAVVTNVNTATGQATNVSKGTGAITDRDQWLGLASNFGKLRVGTISTSYKSHGAMIDPIYRTAAQGRDWGLQSNLHTGAGDSGQGRATNTLRYDSPTFVGITATGHYTLQKGTNDDTDNPWGLGAQWKAGGFLVFADYITSDGDGDNDAYKIGGRFGFDKFAVFGQYEVDGGLISTNRNLGLISDGGIRTIKGAADGSDTWFVGGTAGFGNELIYASFGGARDGDGVVDINTGDDVDTQYYSWEIVGVHNLSKRSKLYLGYVAIDPEDAKRIDNWTLGMKHVF